MKSHSLDHLIGEQQGRQNFEAERFCGLEVDDELELDRRFYRQICGLGAFKMRSTYEAVRRKMS
jgi:hypothetical protein